MIPCARKDNGYIEYVSVDDVDAQEGVNVYGGEDGQDYRQAQYERLVRAVF
jgi:hypothetical protein